jgi:hypothetical protein
VARIVVAGWVTGLPTASFFWHAVSFAVGFRDAGHEVWFLEDSGDYPWSYDPETQELDESAAYGVRLLAGEMEAIGMGDRWVYRHGPTDRHDGLSVQQTQDVLAEADVFVNVSLTTPMRPEYVAVPQRLAIDTDPVFSQVRIAQGDWLLGGVADSHTRLFTFGRSPLPAEQHEWVPTRQPVATRYWSVEPHPGAHAPFTTIMTWKAYPPVEWNGVVYGAKDRSMSELLDLPTRTDCRLEVALGGGNDHWQAQNILKDNGWELSDPMEANASSAQFHRFLARSAGEFGIAKHGYVAARSGWFSERTCCYLASGRPAVVADTGWRDWLPDGEGLFAYASCDDAVAALEHIRSDPGRHAQAARKIAEEHFEAADVCSALLAAL